MNGIGMKATVEDVGRYWDSHLNLTQFFESEAVAAGSDEFYSLLERSLSRYSYKEPLLREFALDCEGKQLLEVGCGLGVELGELGALGFEVTGVDLAKSAVAVANEYLKRKGVPGRALVQDAERLEFGEATFDAVYSCGVLQHTPDIEKAIDEIWRVLKPGGRILIILYHRQSWFYLLHRLSGMNVEFQAEDAPIINTYTREELRRLFRRFPNIRVRCEYCRPLRTNRGGLLAGLYNHVFVPVMRAVPEPVVQGFGWHLVLTGRK